MEQNNVINNEELNSVLEMEKTLENIFCALKDKGYDPATQLAGYILSEDPLYMPDWKNARGLISHIDRDDLLKLIIEYYFENRFEKNKWCGE